MTPGTQFKLTGKFLRDTGQHTGAAGQSIWTVVKCGCSLCHSGTYVASNEESYSGEGQRHFALANVYTYGTLDHRNVA
jgi:hypothetical protein